MTTLLCIDAGNTRIKWQVRSNGRSCAQGSTLSSEPRLRIPEAIVPLIDACAISAVGAVGATERLSELLAELGLPAAVTLESAAAWRHLRNGYESPERLGADRWFAMVAAYASNPLPLIVVDAGTATTVDPIDVSGNHLGGFIVIGLHSMLAALGAATAGIEVHRLEAEPNTLITRNTRQAVLAGALEATRGLVDRASHMLEERCGTQPTVLVTGGDGLALCAGNPSYLWRRDLVLEGIEIVARSWLDERPAMSGRAA